MALKVGELYAAITLNSDSYKKGLDKSEKGTKSWGSRMKGAFKTAGIAIAASIAIIATALIGIGIKALDSAVEQERALDDLKRVFKDQAKDVQAWAEGNAYQFGVNDDVLEASVAKFGQWAINAGLSTQEAMTSAEAMAQRASEIATSTGKSYDEVFNALLKGTQGSTRALKEYGVAIDNNAIANEAMRLGLIDNAKELDATTAAQARASLILQQTAGYTETAAAKDESYAKGKQRLGVLIDTAMDTIGAAVYSVVNVAMPSVLEAFGGLNTWATDNAPAIQSTLSGIFDGAGKAMDFIKTTVLPNLQKAFETFQTTVLPVLASAFDAVSSAVQTVVDTFNTVIDIAGPALGDIFKWLETDVFPQIQEAVRYFSEEVFPTFSAVFKDFAEKVAPPLGEAIKRIAEVVLPILKAAFEGLTQTVIPALRAAFETIKKWLDDNGPLIQSIIETVSAAIGVALDAIGTALGVLQTAFQTVIDFLQDNWHTVEDVVSTVGDGVKLAFDALVTAVTTVRDTFQTVLDAIGTAFTTVQSVIDTVITNIRTAFDNLVTFFRTTWDKIVAAIKKPINLIIDMLNGMSNAFSFQIKFDLPSFEIPDPTQLLEGGKIKLGGGSVDWSRGPLFDTIPHFAKGTPFFGGGLALLGEQGPELAALPHGSSVLNAGQTRDALSALRGGQGGPMIGTQNIYGVQPGDVERETRRAFRRQALDWALEGR